MKPKISVIMPAYNAERFIRQAIDSVLQQTYTNIEVLIADDASKDNTKKIIDALTDPRVKRYHNEKNLGYLQTCNKLFALATGEFITFQDADDYSSPTRFDEQMKAFEQDPTLGVCGTNLTAVHQHGDEMFCSNYYRSHELIQAALRKGDYSMIPNSFLFKREILDTIGGYNLYFDRIGAEDYYWTCLIMEKYKLINIPSASYYYRYNPNSICGDWSDNRRKMHNPKLLLQIFKYRSETGTDPIEKMDWHTLDNILAELDAPYVKDPSRYHRELARRDFYLGNKKRAVEYMWKAVQRDPLKAENYRDFFYYLRTRPEESLY